MVSRNILKEFLISLGFSVDEKQYQAATEKLKRFEKNAAEVAEDMGKNMKKGSAVAVTALTGLTISVAAYVAGVTKADLETEKFARRMWMTETNARSLQNSLSAMGESMDTIYDVAANGELRSRFLQLRADAAKLEGGAEIEQGLKEIRAVWFEFQRFQLLLTYGSRYVAYYLSKYLAVPMAEIKEAMQGINREGRTIVEEWGDKIARVLSWLIRLCLAGTQGVGDLIGMIHRLPGEMKLAMAAMAALGFAAMNPFTLMIAAIGAILLLLDDFYTWKRGGKSLLGDTWAQLDQMDVGSKSFQSIQKLLKHTSDLLDTLGEKWKALNETVKEKTGFTILEHVLQGTDAVLSSIVGGLADLVELIDQIIKGEPPEWVKNVLYAMAGTTEEKLAKQISEYDKKQADKQNRNQSGEVKKISLLPLQEYPQKRYQQYQQKSLVVPIVAGPTSAGEQMKQVVNHNNRKEIKQDNKAEMNNTFIVNGTDAVSIANGVVDQQQILLNKFSGSWFNNAVQLPE